MKILHNNGRLNKILFFLRVKRMIDLRLMKILHNNGRLNKIYFFLRVKRMINLRLMKILHNNGRLDNIFIFFIFATSIFHNQQFFLPMSDDQFLKVLS